MPPAPSKWQRCVSRRGLQSARCASTSSTVYHKILGSLAGAAESRRPPAAPAVVDRSVFVAAGSAWQSTSPKQCCMFDMMAAVSSSPCSRPGMGAAVQRPNTPAADEGNTAAAMWDAMRAGQPCACSTNTKAGFVFETLAPAVQSLALLSTGPLLGHRVLLRWSSRHGLNKTQQRLVTPPNARA